MDIFSTDRTIISQIINRILNCRGLKDLYVFGQPEEELEWLYPAVHVEKAYDYGDVTGDVFYIHISNRNEFDRILPWVMKGRETKDYIIYISSEAEISVEEMEILGTPHHLERYSGLEGVLLLAGVSFQIPGRLAVPDDFKVLAVIHFYNEADILERTIRYLLGQEVDLYLLDNWSDDGSYEIARKCQEAYPGRIYLERFPASGKSGNYEWYNQLEKTELVSKEAAYDWFIHYDADEMRVSPWGNVTLREAIYWIDRQGYNCIENTVIDFRVTAYEMDNIFMRDTFFDFRHLKILLDQLKTWKKSPCIDLKSSAGHFAHIENPKVFPLKFLNRHYPLRSMEQAEKKVFQDRLPRFQKERGERGWHGHYDKFKRAEDFIFDGSQLLRWSKDTFQELYIPLFLECGIRWDMNKNSMETDLPDMESRKVILYGAGNLGKCLYPKLAEKNQIVRWVDKQYKMLPAMYCEKVAAPQEISQAEYDCIVLAVKKETLVQEIKGELTGLYGVPEDKILSMGASGGK